MKIKYLKILVLLFVVFSCSKEIDIDEKNENENVVGRWAGLVPTNFQFYVAVRYEDNLDISFIEDVREQYFKDCDNPVYGFYECLGVDYYAVLMNSQNSGTYRRDDWLITICQDRNFSKSEKDCMTRGIRGDIADDDGVDVVN